MLIFGFSLNMLTLLGLILAIGIVVDDAIVVVENVERIMEEEHLGAYEATKKSHDRTGRCLDSHVISTGSRIRTGQFLAGHHGTTLPPVHRNDCGIGTDFYGSSPDAESGHVLAHPETDRPEQT